MAENIKVVIADDSPILRSSLATLFQVSSGLEVIGTAATGQEAVDLCLQLHPDVVIMDMLMPEMDGLEATRAILDHDPDIQVIVLTTGYGWLADDAIAAGASAYLLKSISGDEIVATILDTYAKTHPVQ
jgi:two-component system, NarL family, response regulator